MKNFIAAFLLFFVVNATCHAENIVNVCDFDSRGFCETYNRWLNLAGLSEKAAIDKSRIVTRPHADYDEIFLPLQNFKNGNGTAIELVADKDGNIFGISLQNSKKSTSDDMATALAITLILIGLNNDELEDLLDDLQLNNAADKFIPSIGKFLKVEGDAFANNGVGDIKIMAHVY